MLAQSEYSCESVQFEITYITLLFNKILKVLKSGDYIDVNQDEPYGDVLIMKTPKLKQSFETDEVNPS